MYCQETEMRFKYTGSEGMILIIQVVVSQAKVLRVLVFAQI